jgi:hypothetical protein
MIAASGHFETSRRIVAAAGPPPIGDLWAGGRHFRVGPATDIGRHRLLGQPCVTETLGEATPIRVMEELRSRMQLGEREVRLDLEDFPHNTGSLLRLPLFGETRSKVSKRYRKPGL